MEGIADLECRALQQDMQDELPPMLSCRVIDHIIDSDKKYARFALD
jgi:hypothetical protein